MDDLDLDLGQSPPPTQQQSPTHSESDEAWEDVETTKNVNENTPQENKSDISDIDSDEFEPASGTESPLTSLTPIDTDIQHTKQQLTVQSYNTIQQQCIELLQICQHTMQSMSVIVADNEYEHKQTLTEHIEQFFNTSQSVRYSLQQHILNQKPVRTDKFNAHSDKLKLNVAKQRLRLLQQQLSNLQTNNTQADVT